MLNTEDRQLLDRLYFELVEPNEAAAVKLGGPKPIGTIPPLRKKGQQMEHIPASALKPLADSGIHLRALELLGVNSHLDVSYEAYLEALVKANRERAGEKFVDSVAQFAGVEIDRSSDDQDHASGALHRAAESLLAVQGKTEYSADEYLDAINAIRLTVGA